MTRELLYTDITAMETVMAKIDTGSEPRVSVSIAPYSIFLLIYSACKLEDFFTKIKTSQSDLDIIELARSY